MDKNKKYNCFFEFTLDIVGGKWKPIILYYININSVARHNERMLTRQLRELEEDNLIERKVYPVVPPKVEYRLTEYGKSLIPILKSLVLWGKDYAKAIKFDNFKMDLPE